MKLSIPPEDQRLLAPTARVVLVAPAFEAALKEIETSMRGEFLNSTPQNTQESALAYKQASALFTRLRRTLEMLSKADA